MMFPNFANFEGISNPGISGGHYFANPAGYFMKKMQMELTIFALIFWFPGTQKTNTGNPGSQVN